MDSSDTNSGARKVIMGLPLAMCFIGSLEGQTRETAKLDVRDNLFEDRFGFAVAVSEEYALVTEPNDQQDDRPGAFRGGAFFFRRSPQGWKRHQQVWAPDVFNAHLGNSCAMDGPFAVLGHQAESSKVMWRGAAYVYELLDGVWRETQMLEPDLLHRKDVFGVSVAVDGDRILIGAKGDDEAAEDDGAGYVFEKGPGGWAKAAKLLPDDAAAWNIGAGLSVALSGDTAVLGSAQERVYVFERVDGVWRQSAILEDPKAVDSQDEFGTAVAIDGKMIAVGEPTQAFPNSPRPGSVALFERNANGNWVFQQKIHAKDWKLDPKLGTDWFGTSIALHGDRLLVGAPAAADLDGKHLGQAYLFQRKAKGWKQIDRFTAAGHTKGQFTLGNAVALSDSFALVGDDTGFGSTWKVQSGTAYVYELPLGEPVCDAVPNSTGQPADLSVLGSVSADVGAIDLHAAGLPRHALGMFLLSGSAGFVPNPGGSDGNLCLGRPVGRFAESLASSGAEGRLDHVVDTAALPLGAGAAIRPGDTWLFQAWFEDPWPGYTSNFTDAVAVTFE